MRFVNRGKGWWLLLSLVFMVSGPRVSAQDTLKNLPELSLPLTAKKMVIAHCMTNIMRYKGHKFEDSCNPDYYPLTDNPTACIGGLTQVLPMEDTLLKGASLDSAVSFEMRAAMASGIDGFQFYYPLHTEAWDDIIKAYFRVAAREQLAFSFTFCISHPSGGDETYRIASFAGRINGIMNEVGRDNPRWLRTPDGRLIVYMWSGEGLADVPADPKGLPPAYYIARAYHRLADAVHEKFACVFTINEQITATKLNSFLDYFPACWIWTLPYTDTYIGEKVADICRQRNRTFTGSVFCDFYTSKLLQRGTWNILNAEEAAAAGIDKTDRKYIVTGLSYNFRKLLEFGIAKDVPLINVITWNDYPEGHHLAPEINHNEGFSILLNYYKTVWQRKPSPYLGKDVAVVFFKKYRWTTIPHPYDFKLVPVEQGIDPRSEDSVDVVTILPMPSVLTVGGETVNIPAGLASTKFSVAEGQVTLSISRNGSTALQFTTPEAISLHPSRTNRLTYSYSSEHDNFYQPLLGTGRQWPVP